MSDQSAPQSPFDGSVIRTELEANGTAAHESAITEAINGVAASHKGRAIDEIEAVLYQALRDATGEQHALSDRTVEGIADRISQSAPHA